MTKYKNITIYDDCDKVVGTLRASRVSNWQTSDRIYIGEKYSVEEARLVATANQDGRFLMSTGGHILWKDVLQFIMETDS